MKAATGRGRVVSQNPIGHLLDHATETRKNKQDRPQQGANLSQKQIQTQQCLKYKEPSLMKLKPTAL